jgi:hypothetical protein
MVTVIIPAFDEAATITQEESIRLAMYSAFPFVHTSSMR